MKKCLLILLVIALLLSACSAGQTAQDAAPSSSQAASQGQQQEVTGRVSALDGSTITLDVGSLENQNVAAGGGQETLVPVFTALGESTQVTVGETTAITVRGGQEPLTVEGLGVDNVVRVTYAQDGTTPLAIELLLESTQVQAPAPSQPQVQGSAAYELFGESAKLGTERINGEGDNQSGILVADGGSLEVVNAIVTTVGATTSPEESFFFGLNAGVLATSGGTMKISECDVNTTGEGATGAFALGEGSSMDLSEMDFTIEGKAASAVVAAQGGKVTLDASVASTYGTDAPALRTDATGTIEMTGGAMETEGESSPAIVTQGKVKLTSTALAGKAAEAVYVDGKGSLTAEKTKLTGTKGCAVMLYQSFGTGSGDEGGAFSMKGGTLTAKEGPFFIATNTHGKVDLDTVNLVGEGELLACRADKWGAEGENGGHITMTCKDTVLAGDITCDAASSVDVTLSGDTVWSGHINGTGMAQSANLTLEDESSWQVTGVSHVTVLKVASFSQMKGEGTIYYDSSNEANSWLGGDTIGLAGGGKLAPEPVK